MSQHTQLYSRDSKSGQWINDKGHWKFELITIHQEYDVLMHKWVNISETKEYKTEIEYGYLKSIDFILIFPDDSEPNKQFGKKSKRQPKLLMQIGKITVRPEQKDVWLIKQHQKAIGQIGATSQEQIFIKDLSGSGICYKFGFKTDERVICEIEEETETTVKQLKDLEAKGNYLIYCGKASYSESEGFSYGQIAYSQNL